MPIKDYNGPLLPAQTPDGPAFGKCPDCGNIVFGSDGCKVCASAVPGHRPPATPLQSRPAALAPVAEDPGPDPEPDVADFSLRLIDRGTLGVEAVLTDSDGRQATGTGETPGFAFVAAWDAYDRPPLDEQQVQQAIADLGQVASEDQLRDIIQRIARMAQGSR